MIKQFKKPSPGKLLISVPELSEQIFDRSVILMADHSKDGSIGLIINKPILVKSSEILDDFPENNLPIFLGGPVNTDNLFILHTLGDKIKASREVYNGLYWGGDIDTIKDLVSQGIATKENMHFYLGYAGWNPGQLNSELNNHTWLIVNSSNQDVFNNKPDQIWSNFLKNLGSEYAIWANKPANPIMN